MTGDARVNRSDISPLPTHVAIIMDGNGRWARERGLPRLAGHRAGTENVHRVTECFIDYKVDYLTLYAFSTENWSRPKSEIRGLFRILGEVIDEETEALHKNGIRVRHLGSLERLPQRLRGAVGRAIELTKENDRMTLAIAFNYGGRTEIVDAVRRIISEGTSPESIDEALLESYLHTSGLPDPDLIIRTAGEMRLSNFLIWQTAYSEYYSTPTFWPDFGPDEIERALLEYSRRRRRFGGIEPEV